MPLSATLSNLVRKYSSSGYVDQTATLVGNPSELEMSPGRAKMTTKLLGGIQTTPMRL